MSEHRVKVDSGKYEFVCEGFGAIDILRHGQPWHSQTQASNALHAIMCELDAARVVVQAARVCLGMLADLCPLPITAALDLHDALTSDREPPSAWCGMEYAERQSAEESRVAESRDTYRAFKDIDTAATVPQLEALLRSLAGKLGPADRDDATQRYYQRKAWLETQTRNQECSCAGGDAGGHDLDCEWKR